MIHDKDKNQIAYLKILPAIYISTKDTGIYLVRLGLWNYRQSEIKYQRFNINLVNWAFKGEKKNEWNKKCRCYKKM